MYSGRGKVRSPTTDAAPLAVLRRQPQNTLPEFGAPLPLVTQPFASNPELAALPGQPDLVASPDHLYEVGLTTAAMGFHTAALEAMRDCTALAPDHAAAWRKLSELLRLAGEDSEADAAALRAGSANAGREKPTGKSVPMRPNKAERKLGDLLRGKTAEDATVTLRNHLVANPRDAAAMRLLARLEMRAGDSITCWRLLERALYLCPDYTGAREDYVQSLLERRRHANIAAAETARLLAEDPRNAHYRYLHAHATMFTGDLPSSIEVLAGLLRQDPRNPLYWLPYAQALHFMGRRDECVQAYRTCLELQPDMGEAYWGLADLKGKFITADDIAAMRALLENTLEPNSRFHMLYALAHAMEQAGDFPASFAAYNEGARLFRAQAEQRAATGQDDRELDQPEAATRVERTKAVFSRENLTTRLVQATKGDARVTPIFVIGMPRAGSTLVEQILASHSLVEGTRELPLIGDITRDLALSRMLVVPNAYPECILDLTQDQLAALGARYLERAGEFMKTSRPYFIDKRPWNWLDAGLIHLILPQAKIIDIRREPMAACFAMFKQLLPSDAAFSYDFNELGLYYNKYVALMEHWQSVLPGRIHFVQYEQLVEDTEIEIRRMLDYCGLPFEDNCLRFWETDRTISTPSAEQVRRPIYRDALQQWRNFEPWLGPLRDALSQPSEV